MQVIKDTMTASMAVIAMGVIATALGGVGAMSSIIGFIVGRGSGQLGYDLLALVMVAPVLGGAGVALGLVGTRAGWATFCHAKKAFGGEGIATGVTKATLSVVGITFGVAGVALGALGVFNGVNGVARIMGGVGAILGTAGAWIAFSAARRGIAFVMTRVSYQRV